MIARLGCNSDQAKVHSTERCEVEGMKLRHGTNLVTADKDTSPQSQRHAMRIALVVADFPRVSETFIIEIAAGLTAMGHDVSIVALSGHAPTAQAYDLDEPDRVARRFAYSPNRPPGLVSRMLHSAGFLARSLASAPAQTLHLLNVRRLGRDAVRLQPLYAARGLRDLDSRSFDVIHAQFGLQARLVSHFRDCGMISGALVTHFRGADISAFVRQRGPKVYADLFERCERFLTNCEFFRQKAIDIGCPRDRIEVFVSSVNLGRFRFDPVDRPRDGPLRVISIGRLAGKKGFDTAIRAVAELIREGADITYTIFGDGPEHAALSQTIRETGMTERIALAGARAPSEIPALLKAAHVVAGPSVTSSTGDQDAGTNVLKEAMAVGRPVIATKHGGIPELVEDGVTGLLAQEADTEDLKRCLQWLITHQSEWDRMIQAARRRIETTYDSTVVLPQLIEHYRTAIGISSHRGYALRP